MSSSPRIAVIGSINMDLVIRLPRIPRPGESVIGGDLQRFPGGKGANQAVAAARLGAETVMVGRVGDDDFGRALLETMRDNGVETRHVGTTAGVSTGVGCIAIAADGQNAIAVGPGANMHVTPADVDAAVESLRGCRVCLLQLELPLPTVEHSIRCCRAWNIQTVLDYAPAPQNPTAGLFEANLITPNEAEAAALVGTEGVAASGGSPPRIAEDSRALARQAEAIRRRGPATVVLKLSDRGAFLQTARESEHVPAHPIRAVDTVGAGDAFTGALGTALAEGRPLPDAVRFANAAGALACRTEGAIPSMPSRRAVEALLAGRTT